MMCYSTRGPSAKCSTATLYDGAVARWLCIPSRLYLLALLPDQRFESSIFLYLHRIPVFSTTELHEIRGRFPHSIARTSYATIERSPGTHGNPNTAHLLNKSSPKGTWDQLLRTAGIIAKLAHALKLFSHTY